MATWLVNVNRNGWKTGVRHSASEPCPTIEERGLNADASSCWRVRSDGRREMPEQTQKPPYKVPSMAELLATPRNGLTHVSTFSGGGGTCLGFRLAGFKTLWANDCDQRASSCYRANLRDTHLDVRPIQDVTAKDLLEEIGLERGELDVFEGSPPCTSFSTAGKRARGWGETKEHAGVVQQQIEDLFFEWLRLLDGLHPRAFVAENVSGMVKGVAKGYFKLVLREMQRLGYRTEARVLDAQWLGVPQQRQRVIFIGVRDDLKLAPTFPTPLPYRYSIRDAIPWIDGSIEGATGFDEHAPQDSDRPIEAMLAGRVTRVKFDPRGQFTTKEMDVDRDQMMTVTVENRAHIKVETTVTPHASPTPRVRKANKSRPLPTVLADHRGFSDIDIGADVDRRKLTILEVKRLCSFPDDYDLKPAGGYTHQWARLGNSVPPLMAFHIATALASVLRKRR